MEATVTLKLTPREFDLIRTAVEVRQAQQEARGKEKAREHAQAASIRASRQESVELHDILSKLWGRS